MSRKVGIYSVKAEIATKEDCNIFGKSPKIKTRICPQNGDFVKCNAVCTMCPYALAELELNQGRNKNV